jgi:hypothetical protein
MDCCIRATACIFVCVGGGGGGLTDGVMHTKRRTVMGTCRWANARELMDIVKRVGRVR